MFNQTFALKSLITANISHFTSAMRHQFFYFFQASLDFEFGCYFAIFFGDLNIFFGGIIQHKYLIRPAVPRTIFEDLH